MSFYHRKKKINTGILKEILIWAVEILLTVAVTVIVVSLFGFRISVVGSSMSPTLANGETILVNRFVYHLFDPKPNDLVVFRPNGNENSHYYIKRVVAVPGIPFRLRKGKSMSMAPISRRRQLPRWRMHCLPRRRLPLARMNIL